MSGSGPLNDALLTGVAKVLGLRSAASLGELRPSTLWNLTQRELLEAARVLGLARVSRLNKEALLARVWEALAERGVLPANGAGEHHPAPAPTAAEANAEEADDHETGETPPEAAHKFEVGEREKVDLSVLREETQKNIPWGYGRDRVTALPVDPDRLCVYWEVTDDSMNRARAGLGPAGKDAWLSLRVYDVSDRIFDGTNAHSYFDHKVERGDRQWFFHVGKPSSQAIAEIGLKSNEGYFVKVARSSRIEFPRREPVPWSEPEWMTVQVGSGEVQPAQGPPPGPGPGPGPGGWHGGGGGGGEWGGGDFGTEAAGVRRRIWEERVPLEGGGYEERYVWEEVGATELMPEVHESWSWEGDTVITSWSAGPFTYPVEAPPLTRETYTGPTRVYRAGTKTHVVWGPWQVVIRGLGATSEHRVVARWEIYRSWTTSGWRESARLEGAGPIGSSEGLGGASERWGRTGSELRLRGASERFFVGASELRLGGASEKSFLGASQWTARGASERRLSGGSELRLGGASETRLGGASELRYGGASEQRLGGASEQRLRGASERLGGGSEQRVHDPGSPWPSLEDEARK
jgi:hypothetical protein